MQGEVEAIAQMKSKAPTEHEDGLLEYLEDIIGTTRYKTPIEEALVEVDRLNEERGEKLNRLKIVEKEKFSLESKKKEAEDYLRDQNDLVNRQSALWQVYILRSKDNVAVAAAGEAKIRAELETEIAKHAGSKSEMDALEANYKAVLKEHEVCHLSGGLVDLMN